jgi:hypothetical protein
MGFVSDPALCWLQSKQVKCTRIVTINSIYCSDVEAGRVARMSETNSLIEVFRSCELKRPVDSCYVAGYHVGQSGEMSETKQ